MQQVTDIIRLKRSADENPFVLQCSPLLDCQFLYGFGVGGFFMTLRNNSDEGREMTLICCLLSDHWLDILLDCCLLVLEMVIVGTAEHRFK
jgi:hypothetical protein